MPTLPAGINRFLGADNVEHQNLLLTPGQFQATASTNVTLGTQRLYSSVHLQVLSASPSATDYTRPTIGSIQVTPAVGGGLQVQVQASDDSGTVQRVVLLYMPVGGTSWSELDLPWSPVSGLATGTIPGASGPLLYVVQAVDPSGNVAVALNNGRPFQTNPVDTTAPFITLLTQGPVGTDGWYTGPVTVAWLVQDAESPISSTTGCGQAVIAAPTAGTLLSCSATSAGGTATNTVLIKETTTPPTATLSVSAGTQGTSGWYVSPVTVSTTGSDPLAAPVTCGPDQGITTDTTGTLLLGSCTNDAGLMGQASPLTVKVDTTPPSVSQAITPAPNGAGWNNTPVTVTATCNDTVSGIAFCLTSPAHVATEGAAQTVTSTATNLADNSTSVITQVNIDLTPPVITAKRTPANTNGWNNGPVVVSFSCSDALSGVASCTDPISVTAEGANQVVTGTARDLAGNSATTTVSGINVDLTPPQLTGAVTSSPSGVDLSSTPWYNGPVTVTWTATDTLSGIDHSTAPILTVISSEGRGLTASAVVTDLAGNVTSASSPKVNIDTIPPMTLVGVPSTWQASTVTVVLTPTDNPSGSGVAATTFQLDGGSPHVQSNPTGPIQVPVSGDGLHTLTFFSQDYAGNVEATQVVQILIDQHGLTMSHTAQPAANSYGWNNTPVTITFTCQDAFSGVANCGGQAPQAGMTATAVFSTVVGTEGAAQVVSATGYSTSGISATDKTQVNVDLTPPVIAGATSRTPDAHSWYNRPVTVTFSCSDALSGPGPCPPPVVLGEGANQSVTGTVMDLAGNSATTTVSGINVDLTPPQLTGAVTTSPSGVDLSSTPWYNGPVTVTWTATDTLSGIDHSTAPTLTVISSEGRGLTASAVVTDLAGNVTSASSPKVNIDRTPPTTLAALPSGWQTVTATVVLTASDNLAGVAATYYRLDGGAVLTGTRITIGGDGTHTLVYWSVDYAGNVEASHTAQVLVDTTPPTITITSPTGTNYLLNQPLTASYSCADPTPGVPAPSCTGTVPNGGALSTALVGTKVFTVTAQDQAGNMASQLVSYTVGYNLVYLYSTTTPVQAGSTLPIQLQLKDGTGHNVSSASLILTAVNVDGGLPAQSPGNSQPGNQFRYDASIGGSGGYQFNLKTTGLASGSHTLYFRAGTGTGLYTAPFQVR
jgi:hypothetical protein